MDEVQLKSNSLDGKELVATSLPNQGMNLISSK